jgi:CHAT domain-containing protein
MQQQWSLEVAVLKEAVPMIASHPNTAMRAFEETRLGEAELDSGNVQDAERAFHGAERMFDATPAGARRRALMAEAEVGLAKAELQMGQLSDAERRLETVRPEVTQLGDEDLQLSFDRTSGIAELRSGNLAEARRDLVAGVRLAEANLTISDNEAARWEWRHQNEPMYRALVELELRTDPAAALESWEWFKGASLRRGPAAAARNADEMGAAPATGVQALRLPGDGDTHLAVLSYAVFGNRIAAWVWDSHGIRQVWIPTAADELKPLIQSLAAHCSDPASSRQRIRAEAAELYNRLLQPVEGSIAGHERLIIEPDGVLRPVPFELLVDSAGNYLGDRFEVSISPGVEYLDASRKWTGVTATSVASVVGNGTTSGWSALPETDEEARTVAGMFQGARLVLSSDESPSSVAAEMSRAQVFHFSGHAFSDVQSAGLVTGSGELLDALRLPESLPVRSRLVVLSACDTARGSNGYFDDEDSLVRRLMEAGVPEVVASRWMVDSPATLELMKSFYRQLLSGKSVSAALALASRDLRSRPEYAHPFYWAGFSVFGRG